MFEIFVPINLKWVIHLQNFPNNLNPIIKREFWLEWNFFDSNLLDWFYISWDHHIDELIVVCNGLFGSMYFLDYDWQKNNIEILGNPIMKPDKFSLEISKITQDFEKIKDILKSENLFTNSKKDEVISKIKKIYFTLSWLIFNLFNLLKKIQQNIKDLDDINDDKRVSVDFWGNSLLFKESLLTKEIELKNQIETLENKTTLFIEATKKILISNSI